MVSSPCFSKVTVTVDSSPSVFGDTHVCCMRTVKTVNLYIGWCI
jgi:hypothetical protein